MSFLKLPAGKSGGREVAAALLIFWVFITGWLLWWLSPEIADHYTNLFGTITTAIFTFAGLAFGTQAVANRWSPTAPAPRKSPESFVGAP